MTIDFELDKLPPASLRHLMLKANQWGCTPAEALARILDAAAKKAPKQKQAV